MTRFFPLVLGVVVAAGCARLGVWQLDRLGQRRSLNAVWETHRAAPVLALHDSLAGLPTTADSLRHRRATARGVADYEEEIIVPLRTRRGAPGVYLLTPLDLANGRRVLVNRGWVYSPDGRAVDRARFREEDTLSVSGVLVQLDRMVGFVGPDSAHGPARLMPVMLVRSDHPPDAPEGLLPAELPVLDNGPHLSYAIQWFAFATIALVGGVILLLKQPRPPVT
ncbi:MAG TPA: SURF1 family protein [Gemmatimonadales bacterium]